MILIDNGSTDGSVEAVGELLRKDSLIPLTINMVRLGENLGFSGGNLKGLAQAKGEFIALLNNDTEPDPEWLSMLVQAMDRDASLGICASRLLRHDSPFIDSAGDGFLMSLKGYKRGEGERNDEKFNEGCYVFGACAGAALYRKAMINEVGFLDEDFFLIHEDTDLNFRAQLAGWKVKYVPEAIVHHKVRSSIKPMSPTAVYYTLRNSELVRVKNVPVSIFLRCLPEFCVGTIAEFLYFAIKHQYFLLYMKAKIDAITMIKQMLKKRRQISNSRKVGNRYLLSIMTPLYQKQLLRSKLRKLFRG